jgi:FkbM family methyltransferase
MKKVFIDCGYNQGQTTSEFRKTLGEEFMFFAFEANPYLYEMYKNKNPFCVLENKAVWKENTTLPFYVVTVDRHGNKTPNTGASTLVKSKSDWNMSIHKEQEVVDVDAFDFSEFIIDNFEKEDLIILKMDIEGAEYEVIQKMIDTGAINYINKMYVEFHDSKVDGFSKDGILEQISKTNVEVNLWH